MQLMYHSTIFFLSIMLNLQIKCIQSTEFYKYLSEEWMLFNVLNLTKLAIIIQILYIIIIYIILFHGTHLFAVYLYVIAYMLFH